MNATGRALGCGIAAVLCGVVWWSWVARTESKSRFERAEAGRLAAEGLAQEQAARIARLEGELASALEQRDAVARQAERVASVRKADLSATESRRRETSRAIPEGVRLALVACNDVLLATGQGGLRFLHATAVTKDRELLGAELIDSDPRSLRSTLYMPRTLTARLDRAQATLTLTLRGGVRVSGELRDALPESGFVLVIEGVDGRLCEARLPMLVTAEGTYPDELAQSRPGRLPRASAENWRERINDVLAGVRDEERWSCTRVEALDNGWFKGGLLVATKGSRTMKRSAEVERFALRVDAGAGTVSLVLSGGVLHDSAGETSIPATGFAILLPGLEPKAVRDALLGLVVGE